MTEPKTKTGSARAIFTTLCAFGLLTIPVSAQLTINDNQTVSDPSGEGSAWDLTDSEIVVGSGAGASGSLIVPAGQEVFASVLSLGAGASDASGYLEINGPGALVLSSVDELPTGASEFNIGLDGFGEVLITNGGVMNRRTIYLGTNAGSEGVMTVTGAGSTLTSPGNWTLRIGQLGTGTLNVLDGAASTGIQNLFVGNTSDETGAGKGTLLVSGGSIVSTNNYIYVSNQSQTEGMVTVTGANTHLEIGSFAHIGRGGDSGLEVSDGGLMTTGSSFSVGAVARPGDEEVNNHVHVSGLESEISVGTWAIVGRVSEGSLRVDEGGSFRTGSYLYVGGDDGSTGSLLAEDGATINVGTNFRTGQSAGSTGTATIRGENTTLNAGSFLHVGSDGDGTMFVEDGATVNTGISSTNSALSVAAAAGSTGHMEVTGHGSTVNVGGGSFLYLGRGGEGTMTVSDGGNVNVDADMRLGRETGSTGEATVTGTGSIVTTGDFIHVGGDGNGTLHVLNGGRVENTSSTMSIGRGTGATGLLNVDGGGEVVSASDIYAGRLGAGEINVTNGGSVETRGGFLIGHGSNASGQVSISGAGSAFSVSGTVYVGADSELIDPEDPELGTQFVSTGGSGSLILAQEGSLTAGGDVVARGVGNSLVFAGGQLSADGTLDLGIGTILEFGLLSPGTAGLTVGGVNFETGSGPELVIELGFQPELDDVFVLIENSGENPITGNLMYNSMELLEGGQFMVSSNGFSQLFSASYIHNGNDFALTAIPEPSTWTLMAGLAVLGLHLARRRRR